MKLRRLDENFAIKMAPEDYLKYGVIPMSFMFAAERARIFINDIIKVIREKYPINDKFHIYILRCPASEDTILYLSDEAEEDIEEESLHQVVTMRDEDFDMDFEMSYDGDPDSEDHDVTGYFTKLVPDEIKKCPVRMPNFSDGTKTADDDNEDSTNGRDQKDSTCAGGQRPEETDACMSDATDESVTEPDIQIDDEEETFVAMVVKIRDIGQLTKAYRYFGDISAQIALYSGKDGLYGIIYAPDDEIMEGPLLAVHEAGISISDKSVMWVDEHCRLIDPVYQDFLKKYLKRSMEDCQKD